MKWLLQILLYFIVAGLYVYVLEKYKTKLSVCLIMFFVESPIQKSCKFISSAQSIRLV
jgi:hypothetical protein